MFGRQERLALLLLVGVAIAVISSHLILDTSGKRPFAKPLTDTSVDGELVFFSGSVKHMSFTKTGGHLVIQVRNTSVFIPGQIAANLMLYKGSNVSVIGTVQTYRGKKEVVVQSAADISSVP